MNNDKISELYKKIEAQDKIINTQALEVARLKEQINIYENPDDMTLMFMWCDEKAKDKIKELQQAKDKLQNDYQEARDRIDELISKIDKAIEYIDNNSYEETYTDENGITWLRFKMKNVNDLKDILLGEKK